ncbi:MAG TPA: sugar phosphate nucleotidyltransferase [Anaerolineae bacterium]|nr:sugar phosphate nucleotidyltransferase [Anaerolineae bacterium]
MKIVIFAGGSGRRLWPLSRQKSPKQFEPIIGEKSTLRLAVDRVLPKYGAENIFISTNEQYVPLVAEQLPEFGADQLIGEPTRRDLAAAVGLAIMHVSKRAEAGEPIAILWGDNYMDQVDNFQQIIGAAETLIEEDKAKIIFVGETPRFANDNLGWIGLGEEQEKVNGVTAFGFKSLKYRPELEICEQMFAQRTHVWNTGYFVTTADFVSEAYAEHQPEMWQQLQMIGAQIGQADYQSRLHEVYPQLPVMSFDDAILEHLDPDLALVLHGEMGWSDPGTLYALKEALSRGSDENVTKGDVLVENVTDSLVYNFEDEKLLAVVGVSGMVVVNMADVTMVVHKDHIPLVKKMVNGLEGTAYEKFS